MTVLGSGREVSSESCAGRRLVLVFHSENTAYFVEEINRIVKECYPGSTVGIAFPIEPKHFFVEGSHHGRYTGFGDGGLGELREVVVARA